MLKRERLNSIPFLATGDNSRRVFNEATWCPGRFSPQIFPSDQFWMGLKLGLPLWILPCFSDPSHQNHTCPPLESHRLIFCWNPMEYRLELRGISAGAF